MAHLKKNILASTFDQTQSHFAPLSIFILPKKVIQIFAVFLRQAVEQGMDDFTATFRRY